MLNSQNSTCEPVELKHVRVDTELMKQQEPAVTWSDADYCDVQIISLSFNVAAILNLWNIPTALLYFNLYLHMDSTQ